MEILWSCVLTLLICTWQVQHLNVPPQTITSFSLFWRKPFWMLITLLAPEYLLGIALREFLQAKRSMSEMKRELPNLVAKGGWTMTHAFYANMYGFLVRRKSVLAAVGLAPAPISTDAIIFQPVEPSETELLVLNTERMIVYFRSLPSPVAFVTEADIRHRAKADTFIKCVAGLQVFWFIVQVCARKARNLAISQLEIAVLAYAVCTITSYLLWMKKPQDVSVPTFLDEGPEREPILYTWIDKRDGNVLESYDETERDDAIAFPSGIRLEVVTTCFCVGGIVFGAIHLLAWSLHFPTATEKILWRTFSTGTTAIPALILLLAVNYSNLACFCARVILLGIYASCRICLVAETFRSLGYLPPGAFATTWSTYVPHFM